MESNSVRFLGIFLLGVCCAACSGRGPNPCRTDEDCKPGFACASGVCLEQADGADGDEKHSEDGDGFDEAGGDAGDDAGSDPGSDPGPDAGGDPGPAPDHPRLAVRPEHKKLILTRAEREPYARIISGIRYTSSRDYQPDSEPDKWDVDANGTNAKIAQACAVLAWLFDDQAAAEKARSFFALLETDFENRQSRSDIDVNMPQVLQGYTNAWDILQGTPFFSDLEAQAAAEKITILAKKFYDGFVEDLVTRTTQFTYSQNNHNIRAASALAYAAVAFPGHPDAGKWADWAFSELDFFWRPENHYLMTDGAISEGPFYGALAWQSSATLFIALDNVFSSPQEYSRDCRTRIYSDPWQDYSCQAGEKFLFQNFLRDASFQRFMEWYIAIRLPWGPLPPLEDSMFKTYAGSAFLSSFGGSGIHWWSWASDRDFPYLLDQSDDLSLHQLAYLDDSVAAAEPSWTSRFMPEAGQVVFRSDWSPDARSLLLTAEHGAARKAAHDHVDGTSFQLAAYGEYLLVDPGYVKDESSLVFKVKTAVPQAHNLVLIEGEAAPTKKAFPLFGDADAFIKNTLDGTSVEYAEAHQDYQQSHIERAVAFVEGRYFVVADRIESSTAEAREHAWRCGGYAGYGSGGVFSLRADGARWERARAGVDLFLASTAAGLQVVEPPLVAGEMPHVHKFDISRETTEHAVIDGKVTAVAPDFLALLLPYRVGATDPKEGPIDAQALSLGNGVAAWSVHYAQAVDVALLREKSAPQTFALPGGHSLDTDAEFVLLRLSGPKPFALMALGTHLTLDGRKLASATIPDGVVLEENL